MFSWGRFHFVVLSLPHAEEKAPHPSLSPRRGKRRPISQTRAAYDQKAMGEKISSPGGEGRVRGVFQIRVLVEA
jgi:hypothetical protein